MFLFAFQGKQKVSLLSFRTSFSRAIYLYPGPPKATNSQDSPLTSFPLCLPLSLCSAVNSQDTNYHSSLQLAWGEAAGI